MHSVARIRCLAKCQQLRLLSQVVNVQGQAIESSTIEQAKVWIESQVNSFGTSKAMSFHNVALDIELHDELQKDVRKGLLQYRLRLLWYQLAISLKSAGIEKEVSKPVADPQRGTVTIDFTFYMSPGWLFLMFIGFWKLQPWRGRVQTSPSASKIDLRSIFHINPEGQITHHILKELSPEETPEEGIEAETKSS